MPSIFPVGTGFVTTGNVRTTYDPVVGTPGTSGLGDPRSYQLQYNGLGLKCPLGTTIMDVGGGDSVSGTAAQLPQGVTAIYKYVLYKSTTNPSLLAAPGLVFYTDATALVVSGTMADGVTATFNSLAGVMMMNSTDLSTITNTLLNNGTLGSGIWICIGGFVKSCTSIASTALGDSLVGSSTAFTPARVASGTAATSVKTLTALTAIASGVSDVTVNILPAY